MKRIKLLAAVTAAIVTATFAQAGKLADSLKGSLVRLDKGAIVSADENALAGKDIVAVYYSAHWCPPCKAFTPELVKFYDEAKAKHPNFELIFASSDRSADAMKEYMVWGKMNWLALDYSKRKLPVLSSLAASGIPYLIVLDGEGNVLVSKPAGEDWMPPQEALPKLKALLNKK